MLFGTFIAGFFCIFLLAAKSAMATLLLMSPILYFKVMSGFEPRELPLQAGAMSTWTTISLSWKKLPVMFFLRGIQKN
jgi:hypothetical protein